MKKMTKRDILKYGLATGASFFSGNALAKNLFRNEVDYSPTLQIVLNEKPSLDDAELEVEGSVRITEYNENSISMEVNSEQAAILFLSEHTYPGWKVYVDEREEKIIKAFEAFRSIVVPAGFHEVKFVFRPISFIIGRNISVVTLLITAILFVLSVVNSKKNR